MIGITKEEFNSLRNYIEESCGIRVGDEKSYLIESRLSQLVLHEHCCNFREFYDKAKTDQTGRLKDKIIDAITTNETMWFRDERIWNTLENYVLPKLLSAQKGDTKVRIWSAGCSTGQEPYSLAMLLMKLKQKQDINLEKVEIIATDISPQALYIAIAGKYNQIEMARGIPNDLKAKYFSQNGNIWSINDTLRSMIQFQKLNLQDDFFQLGTFDLIFCRNVTIYFSESFKKDFFTRLSKMLNPQGILILGASESLFEYASDYTMTEQNGSILYTLNNTTQEATKAF